MASDRMKTSCRLPAPTGAPTSLSFAPPAKPHVVPPQGVDDRGAGCRGRYRLPWGRLILMITLTPSRLRLTNQLQRLPGSPAGAN
jgi:hypothetical protein